MVRRRWIACCALLTLAVCSASADVISQIETKSAADSTIAPSGPNDDPALNIAVKGALEAISKRDVEGARELLGTLTPSGSRVHTEILLAELLFASQLPDEARGVLETFAVKAPRRLDVYVAFCELAVQQQRWFDGWNLTLVAERLTPEPNWTPEFTQKLIQRVRIIKAICAENRKDWKTAQDIYAAVNKVEPSTDSLVGLARTSFRLGDSKAALGYFEKLRESEPKVAPPLLLMAELQEADGKIDEAAKTYQLATQAKSPADQVVARLSMARMLIRNNRPAEARPLLATPIADAPGDEQERQFLAALVARMEGRTDDARALLSKLHQDQPSSLPIGNHLALVLAQSTDESLRARSLQIAQGNVRNYEKSADAWATLGWIQFKLGDRAAAESSLSNAAQLGPLSRDTIHFLIELKRADGDQDAIKLLTEARKNTAGPDFYK